MQSSVKLQRIVFGITAIPLFCMLTGCFNNFYKATPASSAELTQNMSAAQYNSRYFVLRNGGDSYHMSNVIVSEDRKSISCLLDNLTSDHLLHLANGHGNLRYKKKRAEQAVLNEVHLYIPTDTAVRINSNYVLSLSKVQKIEVIEKNKGKTTASYILGGVGIALGTLFIAGIIAIAAKSSCPFVSAYDGNEMKLQGEIFGGAIYPQLARNDYLKLNMAPTSKGRLQLQISNELKEKQFTDIAELLVVTHDKNVKVIADENGNLHSIAQPFLPVSATIAGKDVMPLITQQNDDLSFKFDDTLAAIQNTNTLNLAFEKKANTSNAKLVLRLKNSYWLDMVYGKFTQGFGTQYASFIEKQRNTPVEKINEWRTNQHIPLNIDLRTANGWQTQENLITFGPLANRDIVVPLDISNVKDGKINVRLSSGFMFWEIDYAAIDFSNDSAIQITTLQPVKATDETGTNVLPLLAKEDANYLQQPVPGNAAIIEYPYTPLSNNNKTQTYFLHAKGYYEHVRNYTNTADINFLQQFKQPGGLSNYSMQLYKQTINGSLNSMAIK